LSPQQLAEAVQQLGPQGLREVLPAFLADYVDDEQARARNLERVAALVAGWSDETTMQVLQRLVSLRAGDGVLKAHPACRELARVWTKDVVLTPTLDGQEHLRAAVERGPTVVLGNHLSYFDTSATDCTLAWAGHADLADRLVAAAGPKVYEDTFRRIAAVCLHTLPVPQSTSLSHTQKLPVRELARQARASLDGATKGAAEGLVMLLYPEGSRTRTGRMGSFLRGVHRYLGVGDEVSVVPCAIAGTQAIMPLDARRLAPGPVSVRFGPALRVGPDGPTKAVLEGSFHGVAALLPEELRPAEGTRPLA
jgi:1-acyl-sn-glycerol-3-phosphate acyltransferase